MMDKAIEIVKGLLKKVDGELDDIRQRYGETTPYSIYDVAYRQTLESLHSRAITRRIAFEDVLRELEKGGKE